tara:strand:+ start:482 stop:2770 length:2289 start_codon:yes stop_codon:yes gene_type:complete
MPVHSRVTTPSAFATGKTKRVPVKESNPVFQEDIFAQQYYRSVASGNKRVYNQIDLENKGGLVWIKQVGNKSCGSNNRMVLMDSLMGVGKYMQFAPAETYPVADANALVSFNTDGFTVGQDAQWNDGSCKNYISYTFAKHRKFFTLLQYEGDGESTQEIEHDLDCVPGMIVVKSNSDVGPNGAYYNAFVTWHRGYNNYDPDMYITRINYQSFDSATNYWNNTSPTATKFTVGSALNYSGIIYNVYIWGHNEAAEDCIFGEEENKPLIYCGYCPDAPSDPHYPEIDCGMPAQFLLHKNCQQLDNNAYADSWRISDKLRGMRFHAGGPWITMPYDDEQVNTTAANGSSNGDLGYKTAKGFAQGTTIKQTSVFMVIGDSAYRNATLSSPTGAPEKTPRLKNVMWMQLENNPSNPWPVGSGLSRTVDFIINKRVSNTTGSDTSGGQTFMVSRMDHRRYLKWNHTGNSNFMSNNDGTNQFRGWNDDGWYGMAGYPESTNVGTDNGISKVAVGSMMAPSASWVWNMTLHQHRKFFDVQAWTGNNQNNREVYHNLEFEPSMIWCHAWNGNENWAVYHKSLGVGKQLRLNTTEGKQDYGAESGKLISVDHEKIVVGTNDGASTGNQYRWNQNDWQYMCYFFGEYPDWSKMGSYTGTGNQIDIDLGFTTGHSGGGLSCVLIKRADAGSTGDWYMWSNALSQIPTSGGCQFMRMNQIGDQYNLGNTTYINSLTSTGDPASGHISGLRIANTAANPVNVSGAEYVYWVLSSLD